MTSYVIPNCPVEKEESWRKSNPEDFFLPVEELLTFDGKSALEAKGAGLWKLQRTQKERAELRAELKNYEKLWNLAEGSLFENDEALDRLCIIEVGHGLVRVSESSHLKSRVEFSSQPTDGRSIVENSAIGDALAQRLKATCSAKLGVVTQSKGEEVPLLFVVVHANPSFSQTYSNIHFQFEERCTAELVVADCGAHFGAHRQTLELKSGSSVKHAWIQFGHDGQAEGQLLLERSVVLREGSFYAAAEVFAPVGHVRVTSNVQTLGRHADARYGAAVLAAGQSFLDYEPIQTHKAASHSEFHLMSLTNSRARLAFQGLIKVDLDGAGSNAIQENRNILLSKRARVDAAPRLQILPQDVSCKHGSASGEIDDAQLYYLMSRGFDEGASKEMILKAFAQKGLAAVEGSAELSTLLASVVSKHISGFL